MPNYDKYPVISNTIGFMIITFPWIGLVLVFMTK